MKGAGMKVTEDKYNGMEAVRIATEHIEILVLTGAGPRIIELKRPGGKNILFRDKEKRSYGNWSLLGGHRLWITRPGADEAEETYADDNDPGEVEKGEKSVIVTSKVHPVFKTRKILKISESEDGQLNIVHILKNEGVMLWSGGLWGLTCTDPGGGKTYAIPLGDRSEWDIFGVFIPKKWAGHSSLVNDPQLEWTENLLIIHPKGKEAKRALIAPQGWIGCYAPKENCSFFKFAKFNTGAQYPLGCNMAFYIGPDNFMVEMETMGPQRTLKPGEEIIHEEKWIMTDPIPWERLDVIRNIIEVK